MCYVLTRRHSGALPSTILLWDFCPSVRRSHAGIMLKRLPICKVAEVLALVGSFLVSNMFLVSFGNPPYSEH